MSDTATKIEVQNPAVIAAFTPLVAIFPIAFINIGRNLSSPAKYWSEGVLIVLVLTLFVCAIVAGMKKVPILLQADGLHMFKRQVAQEQIERITYNKRTRYVQIKAGSTMRSFNVYLGKKEETPDKVATLENWALQMGIRFETTG